MVQKNAIGIAADTGYVAKTWAVLAYSPDQMHRHENYLSKNQLFK